MIDAELFIKTRKEQRAFPPLPEPQVLICKCGRPIMNCGRDEDGELIYEDRCGRCQDRKVVGMDVEAISAEMAFQQKEFEAKRLCNQCFDRKPMPHGRWCAQCCIRINTDRLGTSTKEDDEIRVNTLNYAMRYL